jgi:uncharacterized protein YndB with AHSA1/START domain
MTVIDVATDTENLTLTLTAQFAAPPERVWQVWSNPRQLELWWGPPTWPATFVDHDFAVDGRASYYMTGPEGEKAHGWWRFVALDEPRSLEFEDGFAHDDGRPDESMPVIRARVALEDAGEGTVMTVTSTYSSPEQMEKLVAMGMVEGMTGAAGQIDVVLAGGTPERPDC